ncbi:hypothetical protein PSQ90_04190 [Devosia rhodophyticola]|uniref:Integrase n=1 Tax=Devosia rhodophyticola TaxID=3026423 RepID=A0ABY7YZA8_9HYPH|nr:hypothetical protein [Devosia rhodophyticola]WDR06671.1 hypothetical protein PSQ90_04190 [Devosia rhodophyticola]
MLAQLGERVCKTPEEFKAWSQNLGHNGVLTTLTSYGTVPDHRQADLIRRMALPTPGTDTLDDADVQQLLAALAKKVGHGSVLLS